MLKSLLIATAISSLLTACGTEEQSSESKIVIGDNELAYYTADDRISQSIGRMELGCTVTHIGEGYVLTAGHCIKSSNCSTSQHDVVWNFRDNNKEGDFRSKCSQIVAYEFNQTRDYAILKYDRTPESFISVNASVRPKVDDKLTIFSHPMGVPLAWSGWCQHEGDFGGDQFSYQCDTTPGSSGAVVLNEKLEIVGVHNLGSGYYQVNAGTYVADIPAFKR